MTAVETEERKPKYGPEHTLEHFLLSREVEEFLYVEAALLDERRFSEWLDLLADDIRYWMPMRRNMSYRDRERDITGRDEVGWIDDDKETLVKRVRQIETGVHWSEEPLSRISRLISNVHCVGPAKGPSEGRPLTVKSNFILNRSRNEAENETLAGRRLDVLRRSGDSFVIAERKIIIDQAVLLSKTLSFFI